MMVPKTTALSLAFFLCSFLIVASARCDQSNTQQTLAPEIPLPTPLSHYERLKSGLIGVQFLSSGFVIPLEPHSGI
jgi:hypothetical protein